MLTSSNSFSWLSRKISGARVVAIQAGCACSKNLTAVLAKICRSHAQTFDEIYSTVVCRSGTAIETLCTSMIRHGFGRHRLMIETFLPHVCKRCSHTIQKLCWCIELFDQLLLLGEFIRPQEPQIQIASEATLGCLGAELIRFTVSRSKKQPSTSRSGLRNFSSA